MTELFYFMGRLKQDYAISGLISRQFDSRLFINYGKIVDSYSQP